MKVLFLCDKKIWREVSVWMLNLSHNLTASGHEVHIVANKENPFWQKEITGLITKEIRIRFDFDPIVIVQLHSYIKKHNIDLIILNNRRELQVGGVAARIAGIPSIRRIGRQDDFRDRRKDSYYHRHFITHNVTACQYIATDIENAMPYVNTGEIKHIHNFRDRFDILPERRQEIRKNWNIDQDTLLFGTMVALEKEKGVIPLLHALHKVNDQLPQWKLVVCGEGSLRGQIEQKIIELQLEDQVHIAGFIADSVEKSACFDIAILNSSMEGISNTLLEYFASGRATISTDSGGLAEIVRPDHNSLVILWDHKEALETSIVSLANDDKLRARLGRQAQLDLEKRVFHRAEMLRMGRVFPQSHCRFIISNS